MTKLRINLSDPGVSMRGGMFGRCRRFGVRRNSLTGPFGRLGGTGKGSATPEPDASPPAPSETRGLAGSRVTVHPRAGDRQIFDNYREPERARTGAFWGTPAPSETHPPGYLHSRPPIRPRCGPGLPLRATCFRNYCINRCSFTHFFQNCLLCTIYANWSILRGAVKR
jgi:hypothetical protein